MKQTKQADDLLRKTMSAGTLDSMMIDQDLLQFMNGLSKTVDRYLSGSISEGMRAYTELQMGKAYCESKGYKIDLSAYDALLANVPTQVGKLSTNVFAMYTEKMKTKGPDYSSSPKA